MADYIAYVHVSIPVNLSFEGEPTPEELRGAALENFLDHPALHELQELKEGAWVDKIDYEREKVSFNLKLEVEDYQAETPEKAVAEFTKSLLRRDGILNWDVTDQDGDYVGSYDVHPNGTVTKWPED